MSHPRYLENGFAIANWLFRVKCPLQPSRHSRESNVPLLASRHRLKMHNHPGHPESRRRRFVLGLIVAGRVGTGSNRALFGFRMENRFAIAKGNAFSSPIVGKVTLAQCRAESKRPSWLRLLRQFYSAVS